MVNIVDKPADIVDICEFASPQSLSSRPCPIIAAIRPRIATKRDFLNIMFLGTNCHIPNIISIKAAISEKISMLAEPIRIVNCRTKSMIPAKISEIFFLFIIIFSKNSFPLFK